MIKTTLILLIAGKSKRFAGKIKKQFVKINNKPLFIYTLEAMLKFKFNNIIIVSSKKDLNNIKKEINKNILNSKNIYSFLISLIVKPVYFEIRLIYTPSFFMVLAIKSPLL